MWFSNSQTVKNHQKLNHHFQFATENIPTFFFPIWKFINPSLLHGFSPSFHTILRLRLLSKKKTLPEFLRRLKDLLTYNGIGPGDQTGKIVVWNQSEKFWKSWDTPKIQKPCIRKLFFFRKHVLVTKNIKKYLWHLPAKGRFSVPLDCKLALGAGICNHFFFPSVCPGSPRTSILPTQKKIMNVNTYFWGLEHDHWPGNPVQFVQFFLVAMLSTKEVPVLDVWPPCPRFFICVFPRFFDVVPRFVQG